MKIVITYRKEKAAIVFGLQNTVECLKAMLTTYAYLSYISRTLKGFIKS